jgi:ABC-2 type transport system permease protein
MLPRHIRAILWAQWRTLLNSYPRVSGGTILAVFISILWYGAWAVASVFLAALLGEAKSIDRVANGLISGLFAMFMYWQVVPLLLATTGASLDLKRLLAYPIPRGQLFAIEVALRISISVEMLIVLAAAAFGLLWNPLVPAWAPIVLVPFALMNLFLSAGLRDVLTRLLAKKRVREISVFVIVLVAALPQYLALRGGPAMLKVLSMRQSVILPWAAAGELAAGRFSLAALTSIVMWTSAAYAFGRWQFNKGLRFDAAAAASGDRPATAPGSFLDRVFRLPGRIFRDPVGALVEKDLRFLSRAPRFRLVFLMGFSFGLAVWLPIAYGRRMGPSFLNENVLTFVSVYAMLLLGEVLIWNFFGYDRSAFQLYHLAPVAGSKILFAKNITALILILLEVSIITVVCLAIRLPLTGVKIAESFAVTLVMTVFLISFGNLSSTHYPKAIDPSQSWRSSARGFQMLLVLLYPLAASPLALAYLARYAFESEAMFYLVLLFDLALGAVVYWIAMQSAVEAFRNRKERTIAELSEGEGPISLNA